MNQVGRRSERGFTIVELLIVVVVIGILAAITVVAYGGVRNRANDVAVQTNLRGIGTRMQQYYATNSILPSTTAELTSLNMKVSGSSYGGHYTASGLQYNMAYCRDVTTGKFVLVAASKSGAVYVFSDGVESGTGPMTTIATTCSNNGLPGASTIWLYSGSAWQYGIQS